MSTKSEPIATAKPSSEKKLTTIEEFTFDRLSDVNAVKNEFTGGTNKFCLGCIPLACCPMEDSEYRSFFETNPSALKLVCVLTLSLSLSLSQRSNKTGCSRVE